MNRETKKLNPRIFQFLKVFTSASTWSFINFTALENAAAPNFEGETLGHIISELLGYLYPLAGLVLLVFIIFGGYQIMLSGGDPKKLADGKAKITNGTIGFAIVFLSYWIIQIVGTALGLGDILDIF